MKSKISGASDGMCGEEICKANEECSGCNQNICNTYTCAKPKRDPTCTFNCFRYDPKCVCLPGLARKTENGPCEPLDC